MAKSFLETRKDVLKLIDGGAPRSAIDKFIRLQGFTVEEFQQKNQKIGNFTPTNVARSVGQGLTFGFGDELVAGAGALLGGDYDKILASEREQIGGFQDKFPKTALGTEVGGAVLPTVASWLASPLTGGASGVTTTTATTARLAPLISKIMGGAGTAQRGAVVGGTQGALYGAGTATGDLMDRGQGAVGGSIIGAPLGAVGNKVINALSPSAFGNITQRISDLGLLKGKGMDLTLGQLTGKAGTFFENAFESIPLIGSLPRGARSRQFETFNKIAFNDALTPIGQKLDDATQMGGDALKIVANKISKQYDDVLEGVTLDANATQILTNNVDEILLNSIGAKIDDPLFDKAENEINKFLLKYNETGQLTGENLKRAYSNLGKRIIKYNKSSSPDDALIASTLKEVQQEIKNVIKQVDPEVGAKLTATDQSYSMYKILEKTVKSQNQNDFFTPNQLVSAVQGADLSKGKKVSSMAEMPFSDIAGAGKRVLGSKVPNSGTAERLLTAGMLTGGTGVTTGSLPLMLLSAIPSLAYTKGGMAGINKFANQIPQLGNMIRKGLVQLPLSAIEQQNN